MALGAFLKDRARVLRTVNQGERVEGGYVKGPPIEGPWFRCYYDSGSESESRGPASVRRRRAGAQLIVGRKALDGTPIDIVASDQVIIESRAYGTITLDIEGDPERLIKGRTILGYIVPLGKTNRKAPG